MIKNLNFFINFIKIRAPQNLQLILARNLHRDKAYIAQGFERKAPKTPETPYYASETHGNPLKILWKSWNVSKLPL